MAGTLRPRLREDKLLPALRIRRHEREHAEGAARAVLDLERRRHDHGADRRKLVEIAQALQAIAPATVQEMMRRIGRIEMAGLASIRADRLGAEADDSA